MKRTPIFLATDFGPGLYSGVLKAVISGISPETSVVDLTHDIPAQDIGLGVWQLRAALPYLPDGSIVLAVVDPGVGTKRRALCVDAGGVIAVGPDNGLLSFIPKEKRATVHAIENADYMLPNPSAVFHGRDIFAPAAAHLAKGLAPSKLGPAVKDMVEVEWEQPKPAPDGVKGVVLAVDRFGNLQTNIASAGIPEGSTVTLDSTRLGPIRRTYADVEDDCLVVLPGSSGYLEIACRNGSAARKLRAGKDATVFVRNPK
jgi:S-adenosyl-L-methionine hydrolase (adenosine-forming)